MWKFEMCIIFLVLYSLLVVILLSFFHQSVAGVFFFLTPVIPGKVEYDAGESLKARKKIHQQQLPDQEVEVHSSGKFLIR